MHNIEQSPYRKNAKPHKEAYQREERMRRILENTPKKLRELNQEIEWRDDLIEGLQDELDRLVAERSAVTVHKQETLGSLFRHAAVFSFFIAAMVTALFAIYDLRAEVIALQQEVHQLGKENAELRQDRAFFALARMLDASQQDLRFERNQRHELEERLVLARSQVFDMIAHTHKTVNFLRDVIVPPGFCMAE